jgi:hypothetical protein
MIRKITDIKATDAPRALNAICHAGAWRWHTHKGAHICDRGRLNGEAVEIEIVAGFGCWICTIRQRGKRDAQTLAKGKGKEATNAYADALRALATTSKEARA